MDKEKSKRLIKKIAKKNELETEYIEEHVRQVLVELLEASESDSVRVAAAKALMDRIDKRKNNDKKENKEDKADRDATINEAYKLLAEITCIKSGGSTSTGEMD